MRNSALKRILVRGYHFLLRVRSWISRKYTDYYMEHCPISKNKIVFDSYGGQAYGDNPKYIAEEIHSQKLGWDMVWIANDRNIELPPYVRPVANGSDAAKRELATAKVVVNNKRNSMRVPKREGQIFIQTWHGGLGFKKVEKAAEEKLNKWYLASAKRDGAECDAIISACAIQTEDYQQNFWLNSQTEILEIGQPRCDTLFSADSEAVSAKVRVTLNIPENKKIVLYAPTFRDEKTTDCFALDYDAILDAFEQKYNEQYVMIIRLHPNVQNLCGIIQYSDRLINGSVYPDIQELFLSAEALITDFSSAAMDFALLNKPIYLCALDYEEYIALRGVNDVYHICPFPRSYSSKELVHDILSFSEDEYSQKFKHFRETYWQPFDDGHAAQRAVAWLREKMS